MGQRRDMCATAKGASTSVTHFHCQGADIRMYLMADHGAGGQQGCQGV